VTEFDAMSWRPYAERLAGELTRSGILVDTAWRDVLISTPRHTFLPEFYACDPNGDQRTGRHYTEASEDFLSTVYTDDTFVTQHIERHDWLWPTSSSTQPSLMFRMLQELDLEDCMTVLEVGTGTGYNAALLSERLGDRNVTSIDIDPELIKLAEQRLAATGRHPRLGARDGREGHPERAPYDRIIATVAFELVPPTWAHQVKPGGIILADVRPAGATWVGALAKLTVTGPGSASGPLLECRTGFMSGRPDAATPGVMESPGIDKTTIHERDTHLSGDVWDIDGLSLIAWQRLPGLVVYPEADKVTVVVPDGSWAEVPRTSPARLTYGGPTDLWATVEDAHTWWTANGCPAVERLGMSVTPDDQWVWVDAPNIRVTHD
jgi:protein-L-isoaspartate(D-aspartate) O-methyltransferase